MKMREIKFRVWSKFYNDWIESFCIKDGRVHLGNAVHYPGNQVSDAILMQYTGLKDKNGKEIYEGDIVSTDLSRPFLIVEYRNGAFLYQCHHNGQDYYDHMEPAFSEVVESTKYHEVIGNIYENPELLEESK